MKGKCHFTEASCDFRELNGKILEPLNAQLFVWGLVRVGWLVVLLMEVSGWFNFKACSYLWAYRRHLHQEFCVSVAVMAAGQQCCSQKWNVVLVLWSGMTWWGSRVLVTKWTYFRSYHREWVGRCFLLTLPLGSCRLNSAHILDILALAA